MECNLLVHLVDGSIIRARKVDFYSEGKSIAFTDEDGNRATIGTKFVNKIESI